MRSAFVGALWLAAMLATPVFGFETREQAFARHFGSACNITRRTVFLSEQQVADVQERAHTRLEQPRVSWYQVTQGDSTVARAYLDTHVVRSKHETLLFVFDARGGLRAIDVLAFHEPQEYRPTPRWYERLAALPDPQRAQSGQEVDAVSGATLTVRATSEALRRIACIDATLHPRTESP